MEKVGVVKQLYVYPVKSMQGVPVNKADVWWYGLDGSPVHLMKLSRGTFDAMPVSLISTTTVQKIGKAAGQVLDSRRFRPNVVIEPLTQEDSPEDTWLEKVLTIGDGPDSAQVQLLYRAKRCAMINLDPDSAQANTAVLRTVANLREARAGIYATVSKVGLIRVGDAIYLID